MCFTIKESIVLASSSLTFSNLKGNRSLMTSRSPLNILNRCVQSSEACIICFKLGNYSLSQNIPVRADRNFTLPSVWAVTFTAVEHSPAELGYWTQQKVRFFFSLFCSKKCNFILDLRPTKGFISVFMFSGV